MQSGLELDLGEWTYTDRIRMYGVYHRQQFQTATTRGYGWRLIARAIIFCRPVSCLSRGVCLQVEVCKSAGLKGFCSHDRSIIID